jgi:hypothetical protein
VLAAPAVLDRGGGPPLTGYPVRGLEDGRLFCCRGRTWVTATVRDRNPDGICEIALARLDDGGDVGSLAVLRGPWSDRHQKNWVPLVRDDELLLVHGADPTRILSCDVDRGVARELASTQPPVALDHLRGGSQALRVAGGWLYMAHEAVVFDEAHRVYLHRFVLLDDALRLSALSEPFYFTRRTVEFCAGLARDPDRGVLVASFGVDDRRACLAFLDEARVLASLTALTMPRAGP